MQTHSSEGFAFCRLFSLPTILSAEFSPPTFLSARIRPRQFIICFIYLFILCLFFFPPTEVSVGFSLCQLFSLLTFLSANSSLCQLFLSADFCLRRLFSLQTFLSTQFLSSEVCVPEYIKEIQLFLINI